MIRAFVRVAVMLALVAGWLAAAPEPVRAQEKLFTLPSARVDVRVLPSGALSVTESITFAYAGSFSGAFREIPLRPGEAIVDVSVSEGGTPYTPGSSAEIGSSGPPGSFGTTATADGIRIVWHYSALNETRTFDIAYTFTGLAIAYDDVVDVNLRAWGDHWDVMLEALEAEIRLPAGTPGEVRVWGHPASVSGFTEVLARGNGARLQATGVSGGRWVEMRLVFPRSVLDDTPSAARIRAGNGLAGILEEERAFAAAAQADRSRIEWARRNWPVLAIVLLLLATAPAALVGYVVWRRFGREPEVSYVPEHVFEPPGHEAPALIAALLEPGHNRTTGNAFAATLFDLIRRKQVFAMPTTTVRDTWAGFKQEDISDLAIRPASNADDESLEAFEQAVMRVVEKATQQKEHVLVTELDDEIESKPTFYSERFQDFKHGVMSRLTKLG